MDENLFYYFYNNKIVGVAFEINTDLNKGYTPLTKNQLTYYLENPDTPVSDIKSITTLKSAKALKAARGAEPALTEWDKEAALMDVKSIYAEALNTVSQIDYSLAVATLMAETIGISTPPMTTEEAKNIIKEFISVVNKANPQYETAKTAILEAQTQSDIDSAVDSFRGSLTPADDKEEVIEK